MTAAEDKRRIRGIIFDMDNTLVQSRIDFAAMKRDVYAYLLHHGYAERGLNLQQWTTSMLVEQAKREGMNEAQYDEAMLIARRHEIVGMQGAELEPGAVQLLDELADSYVLTIVTNNAEEAALEALKRNGIADRFIEIIGRESMREMKPSPSGFQEIVRRTGMAADNWLSVGDSWIDGKGSIDAGIPFIGYQVNEHDLQQRGVQPLMVIDQLSALHDVLSLMD
ncbi:HAD family hydrolase [Paenibacillus kobensis]|uniref:HAD family hydrolase n=1 Tax=Paenibacillus kobensis TaxID=59841 RepID=UPI000FDA8083|nr:HAD family hydrolase [Paenibacillus kobensis]